MRYSECSLLYCFFYSRSARTSMRVRSTEWRNDRAGVRVAGGLGNGRARSVAECAGGTAAQLAALAEDLASLETFADAVMVNEQTAYLRVIGHGNLLVQRGAPEVIARPYQADSEQVRRADGVFDADASICEGGMDFGRIELGSPRKVRSSSSTRRARTS